MSGKEIKEVFCSECKHMEFVKDFEESCCSSATCTNVDVVEETSVETKNWYAKRTETTKESNPSIINSNNDCIGFSPIDYPDGRIIK